MDLQLTGRVVVVTGGSRGIGRAVVDRLLAEGAMVATCARDGDALADAYAGVDPERLLLGACDVLDQDALQSLVDRAARRFGRLDGVVANAGTGAVGGVLESPSDVFAAQFATKVDSVLNLVRAAGPHLAHADSPAVVVLNGVTAHRPEQDMAAVGAARAAVANIVVLLAERLAADGVRVNAVNLGAIVTDAQRQRHAASGTEESFEAWCGRDALRRGIPLGRMGRPEEVAPVVAVLLSPLCSYVTGTSVDVSGGLGVRP